MNENEKNSKLRVVFLAGDIALLVFGSPYIKLTLKLIYWFLLQLDIWVSGSKASMTMGNPSWVPLVSHVGGKKAYQMLSIF